MTSKSKPRNIIIVSLVILAAIITALAVALNRGKPVRVEEPPELILTYGGTEVKNYFESSRWNGKMSRVNTPYRHMYELWQYGIYNVVEPKTVLKMDFGEYYPDSVSVSYEYYTEGSSYSSDKGPVKVKSYIDSFTLPSPDIHDRHNFYFFTIKANWSGGNEAVYAFSVKYEGIEYVEPPPETSDVVLYD